MKWAACMISRRLARLVGRREVTAGTLRRAVFIGFCNSNRQLGLKVRFFF